MKLRIADRVFAGIAGLIFIASFGALIAQTFFQVDIIGFAAKVFANDTPGRKILIALFACIFLLIGIFCLMILFRHHGRKDRFILQKTDNGQLEISLKALESMVQKCLEQHQEIKPQALFLSNQKDGLLVQITGTVSGGISIPLTVDALQKQIAQYVTACSGVEIKGINVVIESSGPDATDALFAIEAPVSQPLLKSGENRTDESDSEKDISNVAVSSDSETDHAVISAADGPTVQQEQLFDIPETDDHDDRPIHQRLFSTMPEPCIVPVPPEKEPESSVSIGENTAAPEEESSEEESHSEKTDSADSERSAE